MKLSQPTLLAVVLLGATSGTNAFVSPANKVSPFITTKGTSQESSTSLNLFKSLKLFGRKTSEIVVPPPQQISEEQVRSLFYLWNGALATGDSRIVAKRYAEDAVLLPTVSDEPRTDFAGIKSYFDNFLTLKPQGIIIDGKIKIGHNWAKDAGIYEFTLGSTGAKVKARYSFIYTYEKGQWKILHHHSSVMPEASKPAMIEPEQVKNLFYLWNDALATLDSDSVAKRYAKNAVLLPTVSDVPRTDYASIKDYFDNFLKLKPQGVITESHVTVGQNWCKDVGIYEFTMGSNGSKVKARYSFVYVYEEGEWKISHHHSSAMPEAKIGQKITAPEVKSLFNLWNDALATLDADAVAMRYAKNAVLLPTVSDTPRTDYDSIKNYFESFLLKKPQGTILESFVTIGDNWCKDVGIYEFSMGADGSKVKGRYSFVYVYEDGEWKISHHHSSVMPEAILAPSTPQEIVNTEMLNGAVKATKADEIDQSETDSKQVKVEEVKELKVSV
jgi:uncharacterized protein (TIGR02246 family)